MTSPALTVMQKVAVPAVDMDLTTVAARKVCLVLMRNAWRKRCREVQLQTGTIQHLESQVKWKKPTKNGSTGGERSDIYLTCVCRLP